ncbi:DUF4097 family beta strand repeat protein [Aerococcaceae bacterium zg-ZJ1578]|uniref:DUF4097 family beta strand repeat-containing protein n=1 Tax=Aerococcaceae bacterium zg-252 TaxID=2796928 RepID=UPI001A2CA908|nr:DUF4097 family beta strand repeat protein [Aerococcaceae bacterium zg-1578]
MTHKERIIELVRQNVITMDEALKLLEAAAEQAMESEVSEFAEEYQKAQAAIESEIQPTEEVEVKQTAESDEKQIMQRIAELNEQLEKKSEAKVIAKQRLREIEIFEELDELTDEMIAQKETLNAKINQLTNEIDELQQELKEHKSTLKQYSKEQVKNIVESSKEQVKNIVESSKEQVKNIVDSTTAQVKSSAREAGKEGRNIQRTVVDYFKDIAANFDLKNINVSIPGIKTTQLTHEFEYDLKETTQLDVSIVNGDITVETYDDDVEDYNGKVIVEADIRFFGKDDIATIEQFETLNTIDATDDRLLFHVTDARMACDVVIKVPEENAWREIKIKSLNGDIELSSIQVDELIVDSKNGDIDLEEVVANYVAIDGLNGDVLVEDSTISDLASKSLNGDFRYRGVIGNTTVETLNGDIYLTKEDLAEAKLNLKSTVSGDVKVALPQAMNLEVDYSNSMGEFHHRISNVEFYKNGHHMERYLHEQAPLVKLEIKSAFGDVYLKDSM